MNAIAALAHQPEKPLRMRIKSHNRIAVSHKTAKSAPGVFETRHFNRCRLHQAVHTFGNRHVIGIGIMGCNRRFIGRGHQQIATLWLCIPGLGQVGHHGPGVRLHGCRQGNDANGAALWHQPDGTSSGHLADDISPGTCGIDHDPGADLAIRQRYGPRTIFAFQRLDRTIKCKCHAASPRHFQISTMDQVNIKIACRAILENPRGITLAQNGKNLTRPGLGYFAEA